MILELDCGNSLIKWRLLEGATAEVAFSGHSKELAGLVAELPREAASAVNFIRLVSVRTAEETSEVVRFLAGCFKLKPVLARPAIELAGVCNGYQDYERLGLDRWLAIVAAFALRGRACLVVDLGTAVTADFVDAAGQHLGGFICPGVALMQTQLRSNTRLVRYDSVEDMRTLAPGRTTAEAVERGSAHMLRGFIRMQIELAREYWGDDFDVILTGGDAPVIQQYVPDAIVVPDLVFVGLALACPSEGE